MSERAQRQRQASRRPELPPAPNEATALLRRIAEDIRTIRTIIVVWAILVACAVLYMWTAAVGGGA